MAKYIEAGRLREAFLTDLQHLQSIDEHTVDLILTELEEAPAADVAPVVHSSWVKLNSTQEHFCRECGVAFNLYAYCKDDYRYCPYCGAKMHNNTPAYRMGQRLKARFPG